MMIAAVYRLERNGSNAITNQVITSTAPNVIYDDIDEQAPTTPNVIYDYIDVHDEVTTNIVMEASPAYQTSMEVKTTTGSQGSRPSLLCQ